MRKKTLHFTAIIYPDSDSDCDSQVCMDIAGIREALHKHPFEPFSIRLADGRSLAVPHSDFVAVGPRRIVVVGEDDSWSVVEPLRIVSLDYKAPHS